jgi:hypothetical protein
MFWKGLKLAVLMISVAILVILTQRLATNELLHFSIRLLIEGLVPAAAIFLGIIGHVKLYRDGHRAERRILARITLFAFGLTFVVIEAGGFSDSWFCASFAIIAIPFPVAFYLNRNRNKPTPQPTTPNAR